MIPITNLSAAELSSVMTIFLLGKLVDESTGMTQVK